jgi:hydrogenase/urease accessory protein HupE
MRRALLAVVALLAVLVVSGTAAAHAVGLSRGDYAMDGRSVAVTLTFARGDVLVLAPSIDANADGVLTDDEIGRAAASLRTGIADRIAVHSGDEACAFDAANASLTQGDGLVVHATYRCPSSSTSATVDLAALLDELPTGHRHMARLLGQDRDVVLFRGVSALTLNASAAEGPSSAPRAGALQLFRMGIEHILTGYDHLLFLLGLVLVAPRARSLLPVVTAFTVAHSITLGVAVLGLWTPPSRIVEPAIALSIAYVGVENVLSSGSVGKRWRVTFPFGLIHGFGFASALRELALPRQAVPVALLSFNLGVEAGQLAVLAAMIPLVVLARRARWLEGARARVPSLGVAVVGAVWFVARIV